MNFKEIKELIRLVNQMELSEFKMKEGEFELLIRTKEYNKSSVQPVIAPQQQIVPVPTSTAMPQPSNAAAPAPAAAPAESKEPPAKKDEPAVDASKNDEDHLVAIKSPIVGTFYRAQSPDKPPYAKVGDTIKTGDVVCIVEAMKLFNEIESEVSGKVVKVLVEDASPVEYDQALFLIDPS